MQELHGKNYIFRLLAQIFSVEPDLKLLHEVAKIDLPEKGNLEGVRQLVESVRSSKDSLETFQEELAIEFARLFIGPIKALSIPYASWHLSDSRQLMTDETVEVRQRYLDAGMVVRELYRVPDDHVAIELEFLSYLTAEMIEAHAVGNSKRIGELQKIQDDFVTEHMQKWIPGFVDSIDRSDIHPFYKGAALLLEEVIMSQELLPA
ncbi:TorD/DmsD family molecular chaperone [Trichlorobacter lovleyi]|uniref:TorD/DmsD family molecular chaperone n=1 Tax=Trichlorobacter lovleyi TaxID=313985 RepID=UPI0023F48851|nr:molecular chaperone TorD family protein [Trichlorobacter lovleyi]